MTTPVGVAKALETPVDTTGINLQVEPNFDPFNGDAAKYDLKAEAECIKTATEFKTKKSAAAFAQLKRTEAFKDLLINLAICKAVKIGRGGRDGEWGTTLPLNPYRRSSKSLVA